MNVAGSSSQGPPIRSLPSSTKSKLRSTQILTSLPQLVSELVQNSLDAGARNVEVSIDPEDWQCWVRDDGTGMSRDGLALLAGGPETGRYGTSKAYNAASLDEVNTFGFRGEALASIANLCCLEISSRTRESHESWSIILKGDQTLYIGPSLRWRRESPGTVMSVRDAFYNLPIRRKAHPNPMRTIELVRREISVYSLVFPDVSFTLENTSKAKDGQQTKSPTRLLTVPKTSSTLLTFRHLYGKALARHVEEINENYDDMRLEGFVSLDGAHSKGYQFIYVNRHPVETCELHRSIEGVFVRSSFSRHAYDEHGTFDTHRSAARRSPRKIEKKAVYVLNLNIPPRFVDNAVEPAKAAVQLQNSASAVSFLSSVVESVLVRHGFLSRRPQKTGRGDDPPPARKTRKVTHVGGSDPSGLSLWDGRFSSQPAPVLSGSYGLVRCDSAPAETTFFMPTIEEDAGLTVGETEDAPDILWKDPATGEAFVVDARTGNSYPQHTPAAPSSEDRSGVPIAKMRRSLGELNPAKTVEVPVWIAEALQANKAYRMIERKVPVLPMSNDFVQRYTCEHRHQDSKARGYVSSKQSAFQPWDAPNLGRFDKNDLRGARILGQVDRKFIACLIYSSAIENPDPEPLPGGALVLIDQHAADERVRVERFLRETCEGFLSHRIEPTDVSLAQDTTGRGVCTRKLEPPVYILLTRPEAERIVASHNIRQAFSRWGVTFAADSVPSTGPPPADSEADGAAYTQVAVTAVPEVVAEKLLSGDELRDLVKGFLARLEATGVPDILLPHEVGGDVSTWQKALRWCPQELVELINSKACRGAIMFNDTLTLEQCKALVAKLSETDLPFQCAHGRPSLVPLVDTSGATGSLAGLRPSINWGEFARHGRGSRGK